MRKRILCTALLSLLALWVMAIPAMAASTTNYYKLNSLAAGKKSYTYDAYASAVTLPTGDDALTFTVKAATKSATSTPSGYVTATSVAWSVAVNPSGMIDSSNKITCSPTSSTLTTSALTHTMTLTGKVKCSGTVTVTATLGSGSSAQTKTATVKITVPDKPDPTISAGEDATQFVGQVLGTLTLKDSSGTAVTGNKITFKNFPETIEFTPTANDLKAYGVTVTVGSYTASSATADTTRDVTFTSTSGKTITDGVTITLTAYNTKADSSTGTKVTKDIKLIIEAIPPTAWKTEAGGAPTDLGSKASSKKTVKNSLTLVEGSADIGSTLKWTVQNVTTPVTFTATGLPDGLSLTTDSKASGTNAKETSECGATLTGKPVAGYYDKIYITATNSAGSITGGPYTLDVVNKPKISVEEIPAITWGKDYTYTVPAIGGENSKHPLTFAIKDATKSPGLKITNATKGILAGRYESSDAAASAFALGTDTEKEFSGLIVTVKNDFVDTAVDGAVKFTLKGVKPVLVNSATTAQNELNKATITIADGVTWKDDNTKYPIVVTGPGKFTFSCDNLPAGITATEQEQDKTYPSRTIVTFEGMPEVTAKNHAATVTVSNAVGSQKIPLKFNITAEENEFVIDPSAGNITPVKVDGTTAITNTAFEAAFGPVTWRAKNLPAGLKLSVDKSVPGNRKVWVVGKPTAATKADKNGQSIYEIIATNKDIPNVSKPYEAVVSQDLRLFKAPTITTKSLPAITLEKAYTGKILGAGGSSSDLTWVVTIEEVTAGETALPAAKKAIDSTSTKNFKPSATPAGTYTLSVSSDAKTGMPIIVGSLDRMPASGRLKITPTVYVNKGNSTLEQSTTLASPIIVSVKGTAAKVTTSSVSTFKKKDTTSSSDVKATGTKPIYMKALIAEADVKKLLNFDSVSDAATALGTGTYTDAKSNNYLDLTNQASNKLGINFVYDATKLDGNGKLQSISTGTYTVANLPIKIQAGNAVSYSSRIGAVEIRSSDKTLKVTIAGDAPVWKMGSSAASPDITVFETDGSDITDITYTVSADLPYTITVSPTGAKNGLEAKVTQPDGTTAGTVVISGTPTAGKETKTTYTLTVTNPTSKQKSQAKVTVIGQMRPEISTKITDGYLAEKVTEVGKTLSYKVNAKGSKIAYLKTSRDIVASSSNKIFATNTIAYAPIAWEITSDSTNKAADLEAIGLEFDTESGAFKGMPTGTTSNDDKEYEAFEFEIKPVNTATVEDSDASTAKVKIGVKGKKPKLTTKTITLERGNESYDVEDCQLSTNLTNDDSAYITWAWDSNADYSTWGFNETITQDGNRGKLSGTLSTATKGVNLRVTASNVGQSVTGNVKFIIKDKDPELNVDQATVNFTAEKDVTVTEDVTFSLSDAAAMMTGDTKIEWKIGAQPSTASVKASRPVVNSEGTACTVTLTAAKGIIKDINGATFSVTAKNKSTGAMATKTVTINVTKYSEALPAEKDATPEDNAALPESETAEEALTEEEELASGEGTVTYGRARTESGLTQAERKALSEGGYVIAAILPEITTDASGQYDLDVVSLDEAAAEGAELVWFAFPRNAENTEDDSIAEFYDEAGAEIYAVPESKKVVVSPWLEAEVTYAPVIAVKAPLAGDAKTSVDEAEEGDTVTEQAIENAIETPAEK